MSIVEVLFDFLKRFWPYLLAGGLIAYGVHWHMQRVRQADTVGYARAIAETKAEREAEKVRTERVKEESAREYQAKLTDLQMRVDSINARTDPPIRVCSQRPAQVRVPAATGSADDSEDAGPAVPSGADLSAALVVYGRDSESCRRQLTALQEWVTQVQ